MYRFLHTYIRNSDFTRKAIQFCGQRKCYKYIFTKFFYIKQEKITSSPSPAASILLDFAATIPIYCYCWQFFLLFIYFLNTFSRRHILLYPWIASARIATTLYAHTYIHLYNTVQRYIQSKCNQAPAAAALTNKIISRRYKNENVALKFVSIYTFLYVCMCVCKKKWKL